MSQGLTLCLLFVALVLLVVGLPTFVIWYFHRDTQTKRYRRREQKKRDAYDRRK